MVQSVVLRYPERCCDLLRGRPAVDDPAPGGAGLRIERETSMQLVRLPVWLYAVIGIVILAAGLVAGRLALDAAGVVVLAAGLLRYVASR